MQLVIHAPTPYGFSKATSRQLLPSPHSVTAMHTPCVRVPCHQAGQSEKKQGEARVAAASNLFLNMQNWATKRTQLLKVTEVVTLGTVYFAACLNTWNSDNHSNSSPATKTISGEAQIQMFLVNILTTDVMSMCVTLQWWQQLVHNAAGSRLRI